MIYELWEEIGGTIKITFLKRSPWRPKVTLPSHISMTNFSRLWKVITDSEVLRVI